MPSLSPSASSSTIQSLTSTSTLDSKLDISSFEDGARKGVLRDNFFAAWRDDSAAQVAIQSPEEMRKNDPLGIEMWKLFSRTKAQLPNQERMDNLSWRLMSMNLKRQEQERARYVNDGTWFRGPFLLISSTFRLSKNTDVGSQRSSGIAQQLKRSSAQPKTKEHRSPETVSMDELSIPKSVASSAGFSPSHSAEVPRAFPRQQNASAIPINRRQDLAEQLLLPSTASAPYVPPFEGSQQSEFGYVQRRVRKTSVDERRVSYMVMILSIEGAVLIVVRT